MSLGSISVLVGAIVMLNAVVIFDGSAAAAAETSFLPVGAADLCVTSGKIESLPSGQLRIDAPSVRAVMYGQNSRAAELSFTYRGPTGKTVHLSSGLQRRQLGLKLRAQNGCNLVYVMWRIIPEQRVTVQIKYNPGLASYREFTNGGYRIIKPAQTGPVPALAEGSSHRLRAMLDGDKLRVEVDNQPVWIGELGSDALAFDGPVGVRTDNVAMDFTLSVGSSSAAPGPLAAMTDHCHSVEPGGD
jgi:hypothetical protein